MKKQNPKRRKTQEYVDHPRYGNQPIPSHFDFTNEEIDHAHWRYRWLRYFAHTALPANIEKQNFSTFPRRIYVDIEERCQICKRSFLFFALEQRYWFETLKFYVDAHAVKCPECRQCENRIKSKAMRYQKLLQTENRSEDETAELKQIALDLYALGYIKNKGKLP